jgi:hypothetical protein
MACFEDGVPNLADERAHNADPTYKQSPEQRQRVVASIRAEIHARCLSTTRDYNAFMNGR